MILSLAVFNFLSLSYSTIAVETSQTCFIRGAYDLSTMMYTSLPEINQPMSFMTCSFACLRTLNCIGFKFHGSDCNLTNHIPVKAIASSANKVELWLSSGAKPVPHFLVIAAKTGDIYDISTSESLSLPAVFNTTWPIAGGAGPFIVGSNNVLRAWPMQIGSTKYVEWNIGEPTVSQIDSEISSIQQSGKAGWASMDEAMFVIGQGSTETEAWGYINGKWKQLRSFSKSIQYTCAAFVPGDTNSVYFMGGCNDASLHKYSFSQNAYSTPYLDNSKNINYVGCTGYMDAGGKRYYVRVGGSVPGQGSNKEVETFCVNCNSPGWTSLPNYPLTLFGPAVIEKDGILYSFGGTATGGISVLKVYKLDLRSSQQWTLLRDLPFEVKKNVYYIVSYG